MLPLHLVGRHAEVSCEGVGEETKIVNFPTQSSPGFSIRTFLVSLIAQNYVIYVWINEQNERLRTLFDTVGGFR